MNERLICVLGLFTFVLIAWCISSDRRRFPWRVVLGGLLLQFALAVFVLRTSVGQTCFQSIGAAFLAVMGCVEDGGKFMFKIGDDQELLQTFAFGVLPTVIFFSALMSLLYHIGIMQLVVQALAAVMRWTLGTSGTETLAAAANVFVGHTEAPLVIRPYLGTMTRSELCAMMTGGFATVTGGLLGVYAGMGIDISHLLTASVISAPAALLIAKVMVPETAEQTSDKANLSVGKSEHDNLIAAAVSGASDGLKLALNVGAMLIAFLSLIALADLILAQSCLLVENLVHMVSPSDAKDGADKFKMPELTVGVILGYACWPLAWLMGIPAVECLEAGRLIGLKTVANEFIAYAELGTITKEGERLSERSITVLTYALAGFSNFGAIGIQVGGIGGLEPSRRGDLAKLGLRAMFGGLLACCMTGAVAGLLL